MHHFILTALALGLAMSLGCSFADSSASISDSISSPSESISNSSESSSGSSDGDSKDESTPAPETEEETASYSKDVSQLTVTYLKSGGEIGAFRSAISNLARDRGMTDWEADPVTTQAIGRGAGRAGLDETAFESFSKQLVGSDLMELNELRKGYQQTAPTPPAVAAPGAGSASDGEASDASSTEMPAEAKAS